MSYSTPVSFSGAKNGKRHPSSFQYEPLDWSRVDVMSVIEREAHVSLHMEGKQICGACPFPKCSSRHNAFIVWPERSKYGQHFYCRRCEEKGDVIDLLRKLYDYSFAEAKLRVFGETPQPGPISEARLKQQQVEKWHEEQLRVLRHVYSQMKASLTKYERPKSYLASRGISLEDAQRYGLVYLPTPGEAGVEENEQLKAYAKWYGRILFPLTTPNDANTTFAGRTLALWQPGMSPGDHKDVIAVHNDSLSDRDARVIWRVYKTSPCGYFGCYEAMQQHQIVICEGEFDALTLMIAGIQGVVAMGIGFSARLIPVRVSRVVLAFDADDPGKESASRLKDELEMRGCEVLISSPSEGKDWNDFLIAKGVDAVRDTFDPILHPQFDVPLARDAQENIKFDIIKLDIDDAWEDIPLCSECVSDGWDVAGTHADNEGIWHCQRHWNEADLLDTMNNFIDKLKPSLPGQWIVSEPMRCTPAQYIEQRKAEMDAEPDADADRRLLDDLLAKIPRDAYMWWHVPGSGYPDAYISVTPYIKQLRSCIESGDIVKRRGARLDIKRRLSGPTPIDYLKARKERQIQAVPHRTPDMYWSELRRQLSKKDKDTGMSYYDMVDRDTVLLQARINAYREKWQLGEPISLSVAHLSEDTTDIPLEDEEQGQPSQQTTDECANTFAHVVSPSLIRDTSGNFWCDACSRQRVLMNDGKRMGFPPLSLRNKPPIPSGYEEWLIFARTAGDDILEFALDITFEKKKVAA